MCGVKDKFINKYLQTSMIVMEILARMEDGVPIQSTVLNVNADQDFLEKHVRKVSEITRKY